MYVSGEVVWRDGRGCVGGTSGIDRFENGICKEGGVRIR